MEFTADPDLIIIFRISQLVIYFNYASNESWIIFGICNRCGKCLPENWLEDTHRLDIPVRPEIKKIKQCSLDGVYL